MADWNCTTCLELQRAAMAAIKTAHDSFRSAMEAIEASDGSRMAASTQTIAGDFTTRVEAVEAYMDHVRTHFSTEKESGSFMHHA